MLISSAPETQAGWPATLSLRFAKSAARTVLAGRTHDGPLVVQKPLYPEGADVCHAIVVHPPAGIAAGDELSLAASAEEGARAVLVTPGAARWYRSNGAEARQSVCFDIGRDASIEWLPQEAIFFDGARAKSSLQIRLAAEARYIGWEILCFGRSGSGEHFARGRVGLRSRLYLEGELIWMEAGTIDGGDSLFESAAGFAGGTVCGTFIAAGPGLEDIRLADARAVLPRKGAGAVTRLPKVLLGRYVGNASEAARAYFAALWSIVRPAIVGRTATPPRIWST